jgi:hypothetical protein
VGREPRWRAEPQAHIPRPLPNVRWTYRGRYGGGGCAAASYDTPLQVSSTR